MSNSESGLEFTVILYGIVASNALFRLPYDLTLRTGMLLFAFFILATDWIEYQFTVEEFILDTVDSYLFQFSLDILILVAATFLTVVPPKDIQVYAGIVAVVVALQGIWDWLHYESQITGLIGQNNLELVIMYGILLGLYHVISFSRLLFFIATVIIFIVWKSFVWKHLYLDAKRSEQTPSI